MPLTVESAPVAWGRAANKIITPASPEFTQFAIYEGATVSGAWHSANDPVAIPFVLNEFVIVKQLGWRNGSGTMTDSVDVGIYDTLWNRKVSGGGTARSGVSTTQWVDVTDTALAPGRYYLATANNGITANNVHYLTTTENVGLMALYGVQDSTTDAYPLPNPLTNMALAATVNRIPFLLIACRVPF